MTRDEWEAHEHAAGERFKYRHRRADALDAEAKTHRLLSRPRRDLRREARQEREWASKSYGYTMDWLMRVGYDRPTTAVHHSSRQDSES
jgi:hypothetical protein